VEGSGGLEFWGVRGGVVGEGSFVVSGEDGLEGSRDKAAWGFAMALIKRNNVRVFNRNNDLTVGIEFTLPQYSSSGAKGGGGRSGGGVCLVARGSVGNSPFWTRKDRRSWGDDYSGLPGHDGAKLRLKYGSREEKTVVRRLHKKDESPKVLRQCGNKNWGVGNRGTIGCRKSSKMGERNRPWGPAPKRGARNP